MCTAISMQTTDHYFGRNLDLEYSYLENVVITPRRFPLAFRHQSTLSSHFAIIGMAYIKDDYPLYYDAINEKGLSMAGLNFPEYTDYKTYAYDKDNIAPFEFIPWILGQCRSVSDARLLLKQLNLIHENFCEELPVSPLHWMISDKNESIVVESIQKGLVVFDNPIGVLTNSPSFDMQLFHLNNYMHLSNAFPENHFSKLLPLKKYSNGMGALGMPGDWSSQSRFVKAVFLICKSTETYRNEQHVMQNTAKKFCSEKEMEPSKKNAVCNDSEEDSVSQFFHILSSVEHPRGCVIMPDGSYEITVYSSCCNTDKGIYYYKTYNNSQISAVDMHKENLDSNTLISYSLCKTQNIHWQN